MDGYDWGNLKWCQVIIIYSLQIFKSSWAEWKKIFAYYICHTLGLEPCVGAYDNIYLRLENNELAN